MAKKILINLNTSWNIYNFRLSLIKSLQSKGYEVIALAPNDNYVDELEGVFVVEVNDVSELVEHLKVILDSDTSQNRVLFDKELKSRNIENFINKIELSLNE